jgi:hypothetical protein
MTPLPPAPPDYPLPPNSTPPEAHLAPAGPRGPRGWVWPIVGFVVGAATVALVAILANLTIGSDRVVVAPAPTTTTVKPHEIDVHYEVGIGRLRCAEIENLTDDDFQWDDVPGAEIQVRNEHDEVLGWAALPSHGEDTSDGCVYEADIEHVRESRYYQIGNAYRGWATWDANDASRDLLDASITYNGS